MNIKNKKAVTFGNIGIMIGLVFLITFSLGLISNDMNDIYNSDKDLSFGLTDNATLTNLKNYESQIKSSTDEGQSSFSSLGIIQLTTLPKLLFGAFGLIGNFVTGGFITKVIAGLHLGEYAFMTNVVMHIIYYIIVAFILIKIIARVNI